jgi:hypothetical protein
MLADMKFNPRRLIALNINDEAGQIRLGRDQNFITFLEIDSYIAAQEMLLTASDTTGGSMADLFLIDVNFGRSEIEPGLEWSAPGDLRPFGPLLALPFLGREMAAFVPYSNYWGDESVSKNGYVLITISLLLAITKKEVHRLSKVRQLIKNAKTEKGLHSTATSALDEALKQYRQALETSKNVQLVDVSKTRRRLEALEENMVDLGSELAIPLHDLEGTLSIDFAYPPYHLDSIELSSLFADALEFSSPSEHGDFSQIYQVLERWGRKSTEISGNTLSEAAKAALARVYDAADDPGDPLTINDAVDIEIRSTELDKHAVRRIAMEFAWVEAWHDRLMPKHSNTSGTQNEEDAPDADGSGEQVRHSKSEDLEQHSLIRMVHNRLGIDRMKFPAKEYPRLLCAAKDKVSYKEWRTPFKLKFEKTNDAYQLDQDAPSALSPLEKALCRQYAQDYPLNWDGSNRLVRKVFNPPYPLWMNS